MMSAPAQATAALKQPAFRHPVEGFTWLGQSWDIAKLWCAVDAGDWAPERITLGREFIESYATEILSLDKKELEGLKAGDGVRRSFGLLVYVNAQEALALPAQALAEPLVLIHVGARGTGLLRLGEDRLAKHVLGDGNHRVAKAFFEDVASLPAFVLSATESRQFLL